MDRRAQDLQHIRYACAQGVAHLVLSRPEKRNALGIGPGSMRDEIRTALQWADHDDEVRCVVLTAEGDTFCGGGDLTGVATPEGIAGDVALVSQVDDFHRAVREVSKPVIAAVQGSCLGAGVGLVIQSDFVLAADDARFGLPEGRFGHPGGSELAAVVGPAWAKFLIFTGESIDADQAVKCGLALMTIPRDRLLDRATELAARIARMPKASLMLNKRAVDTSVEASGRAAGRLAGRSIDTLTKVASHDAQAPDGRAFEDVLAADGVAGLKTAMNQQFTGSWLSTVVRPDSAAQEAGAR